VRRAGAWLLLGAIACGADARPPSAGEPPDPLEVPPPVAADAGAEGRGPGPASPGDAEAAREPRADGAGPDVGAPARDAGASPASGAAGGDRAGGGAIVVPDAGAFPRPGPGDGDLVQKPPYTFGPDSRAQAGVPKGKLLPLKVPSQVYGRTYDVTLYVPAQLDPETPAPLMVFQDAHHYVDDARAPIVFDNLIHKKEIPALVGIFIEPRDRSVEYDSLGDKYARFLLEDVLPAVGKTYALTTDPRRRAIAGFSSGGICAFTVAWERPDAFGLVMTHNGSFVNIRGGNRYPGLVRQAERKPIKVSLLSGTKDLVNNYGSWPEGNKAMAAALEERGYVYRFLFGEAGHGFAHSGPDFPETLRWLWRE
jgi:enterochelin esterase family protein